MIQTAFTEDEIEQLREHRKSLETYFEKHPPATVNEAAAKIEELTDIRRGPIHVRRFLNSLGLRPRKAQAVATSDNGDAELEIYNLFRLMIKHDATHLHLRVEKPPILRIKGTLRELQMEPISDEMMERLCFPLMNDRDRRIFEEEGGVDFAHVVDDEGDPRRFRINVFRQLGRVGMVALKIENFIPNFAGLNVPPVLEQFCKIDQGMILVSGMTGCGKTTTIASMLDWINHNYSKHILTLEDPIEYVFSRGRCMVNQREVGLHVSDFDIAMKHAVREDPDVILVGEMRDQKTFATAIRAAETGHLVFGTVHAASASATIGRILNMFPPEMHTALRSSLVFNMRAVIAQKLLPTILDEPKRVPIVEIMIFNPTVRKLILEEKDERLPDAIQIGRSEGMQNFNDSLYDFETRGYISRQTALEASPNPEAFKMMLKGMGVKGAGIL